MFQTFLIKYGEIAIKGKNRHLFEDALVSQIRHALKRVEGEFHVYKEQGRIYIDCSPEYDYDETVEALQKVFGIVGICPVMKCEDGGVQKLGDDVVEFLRQTYDRHDQSFKVFTRRPKKSFPIDSMEANAELGVQVGKRLVEEEHLGVADDGPAHGHALALTAGQLRRLFVQLVG